MKKIILIAMMFLGTQTMANGIGIGIGIGGPGSGSTPSLNDCPDLSSFDWVNGDINDLIDSIVDLQDKYAIGVETHGNQGLTKGMFFQESAVMSKTSDLQDVVVAQKILVELDQTSARDEVKRLQTYLGLSLMRDSVGEYKSYNHSQNFKVCFSSKDETKHASLVTTIDKIVDGKGTVTVLEECPANIVETSAPETSAVETSVVEETK